MSASIPITLQVVTGALRAACEEMGAVLIRAAHSANIKERRDASTALFDPAGRMVMQAEHIPVHLGAMPAAVEAVLDEEHAPGRRLGAQRPLPRRHAPARHHRHHAGVRAPTAAARLRRQPRPPRRRRRPDARLDARRLDDARRGGRRDRAPRRLDDAAIDELVAQMRQPAQRRADLRAQLAANRTGVERLRELHARGGLHAAMDEALDYAERRTRACLAELPDGTRHARDVLEAARATSSCGWPRRCAATG